MARADYDRARLAFTSLPASERALVQWDLTWTGHYNALPDGEFGRRTYNAIVAFQTGSGYRPNGVLNAGQRAVLKRRSSQIMSAVGFEFTNDPRSGQRLGIPRNLIQTKAATRRGSRWQSLSEDFVIETIAMPYTDTSYSDLFERLSRAGKRRSVSYKVMKDDFFVVTGVYRGKRFYLRMRRTPSATRGISISWQARVLPNIESIVLALADAVFNLERPRPTQRAPSSDGPVFIVAASRSTKDEAVTLARQYAKVFEHTAVYRTANGWFAIVLGVFDSSVAETIRATFATIGSIPDSSFLSKGKGFEQRVWAAEEREVETPHAPKDEATPRNTTSGTGFFVTDDAVMLTNAHVVNDCGTITVPSHGTARLLLVDKTNDLAALKVETEGQVASAIFQDAPLRIGSEVVVLGYPLAPLLGGALSVTSGEVSSLSGVRGDTRYFQLSAPVQPGNSGGPVLDMTGHVVGIVTARLDDRAVVTMFDAIPQNINFAIRNETIGAFLRSANIIFKSQTASDTEERPALAERGAAFTAQILCVP